MLPNVMHNAKSSETDCTDRWARGRIDSCKSGLRCFKAMQHSASESVGVFSLMLKGA